MKFLLIISSFIWVFSSTFRFCITVIKQKFFCVLQIRATLNFMHLTRWIFATSLLLLFFCTPREIKWLNAQSYCIKIFFTTLFDNSAPTLPFSWPFNLLLQSVHCSLSVFFRLAVAFCSALFILHLRRGFCCASFWIHILCVSLWSWFKVWSARSHLITNKFVWLFHCSHLTHTYIRNKLAMLRA